MAFRVLTADCGSCILDENEDAKVDIRTSLHSFCTAMRSGVLHFGSLTDALWTAFSSAPHQQGPVLTA